MAFLALSPFEMLTSSLQAGFLAFTVYLSAGIINTLLQSRSLLGAHWPWAVHPEKHSNSEDFTDSDEDDENYPTLTICFEYPRISTPVQPARDHSALQMLQNRVEHDMLFSAADLNDIIPSLQKWVTKFDRDINRTKAHYEWKVVVKGQEVNFAAGILDGTRIKPVVSLTGLYYSGAAGAVKAHYPFPEMLDCLYQELKTLDRWKDIVYVVNSGSNTAVGLPRRTVF